MPQPLQSSPSAGFAPQVHAQAAHAVVVAPAAPPRFPPLASPAPLQHGAFIANFVQEPTGMIGDAIDPFLTLADRVSLARTSWALRSEIHTSVQFNESRRFLMAESELRRLEHHLYELGNEGGEYWTRQRAVNVAHDDFYAARVEIVEARKNRGLPQPLYPVWRQLKEVLGRWPAPVDDLLALERACIAASHATEHVVGHSHEEVHDMFWVIYELSQARPRDETKIAHALISLNYLLERLSRRCLESLTADLQRPSAPHATPVPRPASQVHFVDHFADEPWIPGSTLEHLHTGPDGIVVTSSLPVPDPAEGVTRRRVRAGQDIYVHTFNLPVPPSLDMEQPD